MFSSMGKAFWVFFCFLIGYQTAAVPAEYDISLDHESSYDFDTEQSQARYDSRLLSEALQDHPSSSQKHSTPCYTTNTKYEHGQKVMRADPCEMCLCVDGEIFCWWKKCDHRKWRKEIQQGKKQKKLHNGRRQMMKKSFEKFKMIKFIPKKVLSFPQRLPAILHYDYATNDTELDIYPVNSENHRKNSIKTESKYNQESFLPNNILFDDASSTYLDQTGRNQEDKNKLMRPSLREENLQLNLYKQDDLINGNGSFVENENQMNYPDDELQKREHQSANHNIIASGTNTHSPEDKSRHRKTQKQEAEKIQFVDVPLAKHYIITSSGSIENTDILASENVLSQFRSGFKVVSSSPTLGSSNNDDTETLRKNAFEQVSETAKSSKQHFSPEQKIEGQLGSPPILNIFPSQSAPASQDPSQISTSTTSTSVSPDPTLKAQQECVVMGISYKIGTILPQETGNCLQCICIEGANENDAPRVTCSPHNCPPLVLPDLFDTTGY